MLSSIPFTPIHSLLKLPSIAKRAAWISRKWFESPDSVNNRSGHHYTKGKSISQVHSILQYLLAIPFSPVFFQSLVN